MSWACLTEWRRYLLVLVALAPQYQGDFCQEAIHVETPGLQSVVLTGSGTPVLRIPGLADAGGAVIHGSCVQSLEYTDGQFKCAASAEILSLKKPMPGLIDAQVAVAQHCRQEKALPRVCASLMRWTDRTCRIRPARTEMATITDACEMCRAHSQRWASRCQMCCGREACTVPDPPGPGTCTQSLAGRCALARCMHMLRDACCVCDAHVGTAGMARRAGMGVGVDHH